VVDDGREVYLHRCIVGRGGIGGCLGFLGGLFCCCIAGRRVGLVQRGLRRSGGVQSVRHVCGDATVKLVVMWKTGRVKCLVRGGMGQEIKYIRVLLVVYVDVNR